MVIDRLIGILAILLREGQVTAGDLAARFEVSVRTIRRDIDRLCRAGIPLATARGAGGGVSIMEGYGLDRTVLTSGDRGAILAGLRSLDSVSGTGYYRQLMEKLPAAPGDSPDDCVLIDLASWYGPALGPRLELLKGACLDRRTVAFTYCAPGGESRRRVDPARLVFRWSSWYLWGWCHDREDFRLFKLNRMLDLALTGETFQPRPVPTPLTPAHQVYPRTFPAVIRFQSAVRWRLVDEYGLGSVTQEPEGTLLSRWDFADGDELLRWLLTFGDQAELLEPADLRRELGALAKKISEKYDS